MATGKSRNRRSSGTSYSSTITTVIFVALCVLGVWLLTSNSLAPPRPTSRTATTIPSSSTATDSQPEEDNSIPRDIPGEIPDDTIKTDNAEVTPKSEDAGVQENTERLQSSESLQSCMHRAPIEENERGSQWPEEWPKRVQTPPYWLNKSQTGIYGKPAPEDFVADYEHWKKVVTKSYMSGRFAAALKDLKVWVMNVVSVDGPDTLPIIYERGLFGIYHDWCESFSTYPRTYDLLHADHLFSKLKKRCKLAAVLAEVDRIARPGGKLIVRDESSTIGDVENLLKSLHWEVHLTFSKNQEGILSAQKSEWRPDSYAPPS